MTFSSHELNSAFIGAYPIKSSSPINDYCHATFQCLLLLEPFVRAPETRHALPGQENYDAAKAWHGADRVDLQLNACAGLATKI